MHSIRLAVVLALVAIVTACGSTGKSLQRTVYARGLGHVAAFAVDRQGRLWVASSGATTHTGDAVYLVRGRGAAPQKVVANIRGPLGLVWVRSSLYVSSLDGVTRFSGLANGHFSRRQLVLAGPVKGAENNNLVLVPDGRLVMGVSATCDHCSTTAKYSGAVVSFRPDGSDLKVVADGIRAPFGLVYRGRALYVTMNQRDDLGTKTPGDWLAVVKSGEHWRFPQCYGQCAGVPSPVATLDAHAAAGGVAVIGGTAIVAEWNSGRVVAVDLANGRTSTWITGIRRPLPVLALADGSVLIGDWASGTVYRVATS